MNNLVALSPLLSLTFHGVGSTPYLRLRKPSCTGCLTGRSLHWLRTRVRRDFQNTVAHSHLHIREGRATYTAQRGPAVFTLAPRRKSRFFWHETAQGHVLLPTGNTTRKHTYTQDRVAQRATQKVSAFLKHVEGALLCPRKQRAVVRRLKRVFTQCARKAH